MEEHQLSKLTTGMVKPSLNPHTGSYLTLHDQDRETHRSSMQELYNEDTLAADQPEPRGFEPRSNLERDPGLSPFSMDRDELTTEFYKRLQELKNEHQKTLKMLEHLHTEAGTRTYQAKNYPSKIRGGIHQNNVTQNGIGVEENQREGVFLTEDASVSTRDEEEEVYEEEDTEDSGEDTEDDESSLEERQAVQSGRYSSCNNDVFSHGQNVIVKQMWDDFNLKDYLPAESKEKLSKVKRVQKSQPKSVPIKQKEWSPIITIPKPFSMTLREEMKKSKSHTRSSEDVAREERERFEKEELELLTRVRAKDPPAHTFMPLYEEIMERQEQRSRMNKENASRVLEAMVKPFSFMEREKMKEEWKLQMKGEEQRKEKRKHRSMVRFVAKPVPAYVHDNTVADKMKEEQLYRKIKVKIRSDDLMKSSSLPPRMHSHEMMYAGRRRKRNRDIKKATKLSFKPETHSIPNFEALHRLDDMERYARKCEVETTMTEPFCFRTDALQQKKQAIIEANRKMLDEEEYFRNSMKSLKNRKYTSSAVADSIPTRMTESARLRLEETKRAIAKAEKELLQLKLKKRERKERRKRMTQEVAASSLLTKKDVTNSSDKRKEQFKQYQKQQKARQNEYEQELKDMNERLKQRPLLFEQQAQNSARQKAEKKYKGILRNSGLSDDMFDHTAGLRKTNGTDTRSFDEYSDDEFETSFNPSGQVPISKIGDGKDSASESDVEEDVQSSEEDSRTSVKKHLDFNV